MDEPKSLSEVIADKWEEWVPQLGAERERIECELTLLLRELDEAEELDQIAAVRKKILDLLYKFSAIHRELILAKGSATPATNEPRTGARHPTYEPKERYQIVPVYYGTNRAVSATLGSRILYGGVCGDLAYGVAKVGIPDDHRMGRIERPRYWKLQFWKRDPARYVEVLQIEELPLADFKAQAIGDLGRCRKREVLLFVHGYNVGFGDALMRTAQIAYDLQFAGIPALFSWPSQGSLFFSWPSDLTLFKWPEDGWIKTYSIDEKNIKDSRSYFEEFLQVLCGELGADVVHIIAHSMGNRLLAEAIAAMAHPQTPPGARLRQIVLAAPDIDVESFKQLAEQFREKAERFTLYASSGDKALQISKRLNHRPRAGDCGLDIVLHDAVDTIDASAVDTSFLGHSYYGDNRSVMSDIFSVVRNGTPPQDRHLREAELYGKPYWAFPS